METTEYIELFWDCPNCQQKHISAIFNSQGNRCPNCLHWRTEDVPLYEAPDSKVITDSTLINRKPFWVCKVCQAVNEDTGVAAHLLQCGNCDNYQTSEVGGITGDQASDREAPKSVPVGEPVEYKQNILEKKEPVNKSKQSPNWLALGLAGLVTTGGVLFGASLWSAKGKDPSLLTVEVTDLKWAIAVNVQEQQTRVGKNWTDSIPPGAVIQTTERKQRGTRQEQRGSRTVMVPEEYQSDTRTETYYESEQYQSGTRTETYYTSERYQSGTRTETYYESERYQSGSRQDCRTTSMGNGIGKRTCNDVPVYSTRQVSRTRSVPAYSTRQVPHTRYIPVYSTRQIPRTRYVPVYSTRMVPRQEPILVSIPVYDTWATYRVEEWVPKQTHRQVGQKDSQRRSPVLKLPQKPPHRIAQTYTTCQLVGTYSIHKWFQPSETKTEEWTLPCADYDRLNIGDRAVIRRVEKSTTLVSVNPR